MLNEIHHDVSHSSAGKSSEEPGHAGARSNPRGEFGQVFQCHDLGVEGRVRANLNKNTLEWNTAVTGLRSLSRSCPLQALIMSSCRSTEYVDEDMLEVT